MLRGGILLVTTGLYALLVGCLAAGPRCRDSCGKISIQFPFGIDLGCGDGDHRLDCDKSDRLSLMFESERFDVSGINYTAQSLTINRTLASDASNTVFYYECNLPLPSDAYKIGVNETSFCSSDPSFPDILTLGGCTFEQTEELQSIGNFKCFTYTRASNVPQSPPLQSGAPQSPPLQSGVTFEYVTVQWIVKPGVQKLCDDCAQTSRTCGGYNATGPFCLETSRKTRKNNTAVIAGASAAAAVFFLASILAGCFVYKKRQAAATQRRRYILARSSLLRKVKLETVPSDAAAKQ